LINQDLDTFQEENSNNDLISNDSAEEVCGRASVDALTNQLVSSIMKEVTKGAAAIKKDKEMREADADNKYDINVALQFFFNHLLSQD
jgi:hypothetical protein